MRKMKYSRKRLVSEEREKGGSELLRGHSDQIGATMEGWREKVHAGVCLAWKCAVLVFN